MLKSNWKKVIAAVLSAGIVLSFSACGKDSEQLEEVSTYSAYGCYECVSAVKDGTEMTENEFKLLGYDDVTLELEPDGTGNYSTAHTSSPLTWSDGELDFGGETPVTFDRDADKITLHGETGVDMIFQRLTEGQKAGEDDSEASSGEADGYMATLWYLDSHLDVVAVYPTGDGIRTVYQVTNDTEEAISPELEVTAFAGSAEVPEIAENSAAGESSDEPEENNTIEPGETLEFSSVFEWPDEEQKEIELCFFVDGLGQGITVPLDD